MKQFILGILSAVIVQLVVRSISEERPNIAYKVDDVVKQWETDDYVTNVTITNKGNKEAENVVCHIDSNLLKRIEATPARLFPDALAKPKDGDVIVNCLNPNDTLIATLVLRSRSGFRSGDITVTYKGGNGTRILPEEKKNSGEGWIWVILAVIVVIGLIPSKKP